MAYILHAQRSEDVIAAFKRYRNYLQSVRESFPSSAFDLASSEWYFDPTDFRCPHDGRLASIIISESAFDSLQVLGPSIYIRLRSASGNGFIEFYYPQVFSYSLNGLEVLRGHQDWRYDEFRLTAAGLVQHEIEWCGASKTGRWIIESSDVVFRWIPKEPRAQS